MSHRIKKVEYLDGYRLRLHFEDKKVKIVDLANMLKKAKNMLLPLVDIDYFKKVQCDGITVVWPNGIDLCPDVLYRTGQDSVIVRRAGQKRRGRKTPRVPKARRKSKLKTA